jgi:L-lactate dehydrogenase complex protein LldF
VSRVVHPPAPEPQPRVTVNLHRAAANWAASRAHAVTLVDWEDWRERARAIRADAVEHLPELVEQFAARVTAAGGVVHRAATGAQAATIITRICRDAGATLAVKGKSMTSEEIGLNAALAAAGVQAVETDLGEWILQLLGQHPSHIIAPAVHLNKEQVEADFRRVHTDLPASRDLTEPEALLGEARAVLRKQYFAADVGITGANFLVAETGTSMIVTNEGNGDLTQILPRIHVVVASIEKIVPTLEDAAQILRVLARSATGQEMSVYTTLSTGPRRPGDPAVLVAASARAMQELGWSPRFAALDAIIATAWEWKRKHPQGYGK